MAEHERVDRGDLATFVSVLEAMILPMELYPPHDKNAGTFPSRTIQQIADDAAEILISGVHGTDGELRRATELLRNFDNATSVLAHAEAHTLVGLLNECFRCL